MHSQLQQAFHPFAQNSRGRFIFISDIQVSSLHDLMGAHPDLKCCVHVHTGCWVLLQPRSFVYLQSLQAMMFASLMH